MEEKHEGSRVPVDEGRSRPFLPCRFDICSTLFVLKTSDQASAHNRNLFNERMYSRSTAVPCTERGPVAKLGGRMVGIRLWIWGRRLIQTRKSGTSI